MATAEPGDDQPTTQYYIRWLEAANCLRGRTSRIDSIRFDWFDSFSVSSRISSWRHNSEWWTFRHRFESSRVLWMRLFRKKPSEKGPCQPRWWGRQPDTASHHDDQETRETERLDAAASQRQASNGHQSHITYR